jgi:ParB-like chromosome segregation protein Spo0J
MTGHNGNHRLNAALAEGLKKVPVVLYTMGDPFS